MRTKSKKYTLLSISTIFVVAICAVFLIVSNTTSLHAKDLNSDPNAVSGAELVQIVIPQMHKIISVTADDLPGSGTVDDPYITENAGFDVEVTLKGSGHLVIHDQYGNVIATYDKYSEPDEIVKIHIVLQNGVGNYELSFEYYDINDHSKFYNAVSINVLWKPVFAPDVPDTGNYVYIAGYAVKTSHFTFIIVCTALILGSIILSVMLPKKKRKET